MKNTFFSLVMICFFSPADGQQNITGKSITILNAGTNTTAGLSTTAGKFTNIRAGANNVNIGVNVVTSNGSLQNRGILVNTSGSNPIGVFSVLAGNNGTAIYGAAGSNSNSYGVYGDASSNTGVGVQGSSSGSGLTAPGIRAISNAIGGSGAYAFIAIAIATSTANNTAGYFEARNGLNNIAIAVPPNSGSVGIGTVNPVPSAILDVSSTAKGVKFPSLTTAQQNAITSPATGLIVWNSDSLALTSFNGVSWINVSASGNLIIESDVGTQIASVSANDAKIKAMLDGTNIDVVNISDSSFQANFTGNLPVSNLNSGTGANSNSFFRGDGTWSNNFATSATIGGVTIPTISSTNTFTNKRWAARIGSATSSATPTINTDNIDIYKLTAQAVDITSFTTNLSGTPVDGDILEIQITGTAARAITWGSSFVSSSVTLPSTTVTTATLTVLLQYYTTSSYGNNKWVCVISY